MDPTIATAAFLILHAPDGHSVFINPDAVVALHVRRDDKTAKLFVEGANCLVNMADGKSVAVVEPCTAVKQMLERNQ